MTWDRISRLTAAALATAAVSGLAPAHATAEAARAWQPRLAAAARFAEQRRGDISFAVVNEAGRVRGFHHWRVAVSASVLKAMLLVTYLDQPSVRNRPLREEDRSLLAPMIRWSDNAAATAVRNIVGARAVYRLARRADMRRFRLRIPWGLSEITAYDQARFFYRIDRYVVLRHRAYARRLLATVVPSQRWGIPPVRPRHWKIFFKGGWGTATGRVTHQVALLERGDRRVALAILTQFNPSHEYGIRTVSGIAARLLRGLH